MNRLYHHSVKSFALTGLVGIPEDVLAQQITEYEVCVRRVNEQNLHLRELLIADQAHSELFQELKQAVTRDYQQLHLYELHLENLRAQGGELPSASPLFAMIVDSFGAYATWEREFLAISRWSESAWVILAQDMRHGVVGNYGVVDALIPVGLAGLLVLKLGNGIPAETFLSQIHWALCANRLVLKERL